MKNKNLTKKDILEIFKKIKEQESEVKKYYSFFSEKENNIYSFLDQENIWIISDSSTSFSNFSK